MNRKKELKSQYLQSFIEPGVLIIKNNANNKIFIYAAMNIKAKLNRLKFELSMGGHKICPELQKDISQSGIESFSFEIVELIKEHKDPDYNYEKALREAKEKWLSKYENSIEIQNN